MASSCKELFTDVETVKLKNPKNHEVLYLKKYTRGMNYEVIVISKEDGFTNPKDELYDPSGSPFFYRFKNDTLQILGSHWKNINYCERFKTQFKLVELNNLEFSEMSKSFKEQSLSIFPSSWKKFIRK